MHENDVSASNVRSYSYPGNSELYGAEARFIKALVRPGMRVLDLGCGEGRVAKALLNLQVQVWAVDPNAGALEKFRASVKPSPNLVISEGDARSLAFPKGFFDAVIFAFNGVDYIHPESGRLKALAEIKRVLKAGGYFLFSSQNPIGMILSPRGLRSLRMWRFRLVRLRNGVFGCCYAEDTNGLLIHQARPRQVIKQVTGLGDMRFISCANRTGSIRSLPLVTLFSLFPYYLFQKK